MMKSYFEALVKMVANKVWPLKLSRALFLGAFGIFGLLFGVGDYLFFNRIFSNLLNTEGIPQFIMVAVATKLMGLVLFTTFTLLIFSSAVSTLSYLYLDEDLTLLFSLPLGRMRLVAARAVQAGTSAGYTVALLLLPVIWAYVSIFPWPLAAFGVSLLALLFYMSGPVSLGVCITVLLARFFPARRLHQMLTVLTVVLLCLLIVLLRLSKPEALLNPTSAPQLMEILKSIELPSENKMPPMWLANVVVKSAAGEWGKVLPLLLQLGGVALGSILLALSLIKAFHCGGLWRSMERGGKEASSRWARLSAAVIGVAIAIVPAGPKARALLKRDLILFFRDPTQWGQLFILSALVVIYLFNVKQMPTGTAVFRVAVAFWNLATLGLIVSAVAGRFAFTSVGGEGKAYFSSRALPVTIPQYLWAKFLFTAIPLTGVSGAVLYGSNRFLGVTGDALVYTVFLGVAFALSLAAMALAMGCADPLFNEKNPAKAVVSAWGLTYMFASLLYVGIALGMSARPVYGYYLQMLGSGEPPHYLRAAALVSLMSAVVVATSFDLASRRLRRLEPS